MKTNKDYQENLVFWLDWSTRHLKNFQKQNPPRIEHVLEAIHMFGTMKLACDVLDICSWEWCKAVKIPYKSRDSDYRNLFTAKEPYEILGKPMLRGQYFYTQIYKMIGTKDNQR